ncbi:MAG: amidohydrolase family protein, partial [Candidatus Marinimicrobia bacterium]|nr:amidohydrolase family protein [Candidatus Neomarinimicrobiota bacterium]
ETLSNYRHLRNLYQNRIHRGPRLSVYIYNHDKEKVLDYHMKSGDGGNWLRFMGLKYFLDGSLGSQTAWLKKPYENSDNLGMQIWKTDEIQKEFGETEDEHLKVAVHAIGDAAFNEALSLLKDRKPYNGIKDRIEHAQLCDSYILQKAAKLPINICANPSHLLSDFPTSEKYWGTRSRYAFALKSMLDKGLTIGFGSDAPVESINPWMNISAAVHRIPQYSGMVWNPDEKIDLEDAIRMNSINPAMMTGEADKKGLLMPGYLVDLFVCSKDPFTSEANELLSIQSLLTLIDGHIVYNEM